MKLWHTTTRWLLGSQLVARALGMVNNVLLARLLAPASYGDFAQAVALAGSLAPLADGGVSAVITRYMARRGRAAAVLGAALGLRAAQAFLLWAAALAVAWWMFDASHMRSALALAGAYWAVACVHQLLAGVARARMQAYVEAQAVLLERASTVVLAAGGAWLLGLSGALLGVLAGSALALVFYLHALGLPRWRFRWRAWQRLLALGAPLAVADLCHNLVMRLDILVVGTRYGSQSAGWYGGASTLLWASNLVAGSMALALVPVAASRGEELSSLGVRVLGRMLVVALFLAAVLSIGAGRWVHLLYGAEYAPAADALRVLAWCLVPACIVAWGNAVLLVQGRTAWVGAVAVGGLACLVFCLWWWLPLGLVGASYAQLATQCSMAAGLWWFTRGTTAVAP